MPSTPDATPTAGGGRSALLDRAAPWALGALVLANLALHTAFFQPAASSPDANGYLIQARLLAETGTTSIEPRSSLQLLSEIWLDHGSGRHHCHHPPGLPLLLAPAYLVGGAPAVLWFHMALGSLTLVGLYLLCRRWTSPSWSLFAAALMAVNPTLNTASLTADSHMPAACLFVWGALALVRWSDTRDPRTAFLAGLLLGFIPGVRYLEGLLLAAGGIFVALHARRDRRWWLSAAAFCAGAALPLTWILVRNTLVYGQLGVTGYNFVADSQAFGLENIGRNALPLLVNLQRGGLGPVFWVGLAGTAAMCFTPASRKSGILLAASILLLTGAYTCCFFPQLRLADYGIQPPGQSAFRYVLPTFPLYAAGCAWLLSRAQRWRPWVAGGAAAALGVWAAALAIPATLGELGVLEESDRDLADAQRLLDEHVPDDAVVILHRRYGKHLLFAGDWALADESLLLHAVGCDRGRLDVELEGHPLKPYWAGAGEQDFHSFHKLPLPQRMDRLRRGLRDLGADDEQVYWLGAAQDVGCFLGQATPSDTFYSVATFDIAHRGKSGDDAPANADAAASGESPRAADDGVLIRWAHEP